VSLIVVGLNHRTAPVDLLERMTVPAEHLAKVLHDLGAREHLLEVVVLSTCNRIEVYARCTHFHPAVGDVSAFLADYSGSSPDDFSELLYTYYDDAAVAHLFAVAAGLDSMIVGESEILVDNLNAIGARLDGLVKMAGLAIDGDFAMIAERMRETPGGIEERPQIVRQRQATGDGGRRSFIRGDDLAKMAIRVLKSRNWISLSPAGSSVDCCILQTGKSELKSAVKAFAQTATTTEAL